MEILFIQTGGTIDKDYPKATKAYAFEIGSPGVARILDKLKPSFKFEIVTLFQKDSLDLNDGDRQKLYETCQSTRHQNIIITHGTDTMIQTAQYLSSIDDKTIILTGATKPEKFSDSDAGINIGCAIAAVQTCSPGVYIAMHGLIMDCENAIRDMKTGKFLKKSMPEKYRNIQ